MKRKDYFPIQQQVIFLKKCVAKQTYRTNHYYFSTTMMFMTAELPKNLLWPTPAQDHEKNRANEDN